MNLFITTLTFLYLLPYCSAYSFSNNQILDLQYISQSSSLAIEAADWFVSNKACPSCNQISEFSGTCPTYAAPPDPADSPYHYFLFGGPNIMGPSGGSTTYNEYFERTYTLGSNNYNVLGIKFQLWIFSQSISSSSDINSYVAFTLNGATFVPTTSEYYISTCPVTSYTSNGVSVTISSTRYIGYVQLFRPFSSTDTTAKFRFTSRMFGPSTYNSFGLSGVNIHLMKTTNQGTHNYPCAISYYWNTTTCAPCHAFCSTCNGPFYTNCSACVYPNYNYANSTCFDSCPTSGPLAVGPNSQTGEKTCRYRCSAYYWEYNDTCSTTCSFPYVTTTGLNNVRYCNSPCTSNQVLFPNGTCLDSCTAPLVNETLAETLKYCKSPCDASQPYLYSDDQCRNDCPFPLKNKTVYGILYCYYPCSTSQHLHANGTCSVDCLRPLVSVTDRSFLFCRNPCDPSSSISLTTMAFLYPNSTCHSTCPSPLKGKEEYNVKYCYTPCTENQYLYPNGTCAGCEIPWLKVPEPNTFKFCRNPCDPNGNMPYLYPDSSCNTTCPAPLFEKIEPGATYCWNPCVTNKTFLHDILQVCQGTCPYPSITKNEKYGLYCSYPCEDHSNYFHMLDKKCEEICEYPYQAIEAPLPKLCTSSLSKEEIKQVQQMASAANAANSASSTGNLIWSLISSGDSTAAMMGPLAKMLQYIKFMDVAFPEKIQFMLLEQTKKTNKKGFSQKMLGSAFDRYPNHEVTENFKFYSIKSNFFANFWPSLFNLSAIFVVTLLVIFAESQTKGNPKIHGILKSLSDVLKWNVFLVTFCGTIGDIVLYTALEFQTMHFENFEAVFSFILCLGMNALAVIVVVKIIDVNSALRTSKKKARNEKEFQKIIAQEFNSYKALFECYKDYSFYQQIFLFVFIMRLILFNASIGYFYKYPLFQATTSLVSNILMLSYLVIKRPMRKIITLVQQVVLELVLLPFNVCVLILAVMDNQEILEVDRRKSIGNVIFYINVMLPVLSVVLMAAKFIAMAIDLYNTWKMSKLKKSKKFAREAFRSKDALNTTQEKLRNQPMSFESSPNKSFVPTENSSHMTQILDLNDNSIIMSSEINMMRANSTLESPTYPRMKQSRLQMNDNFLTSNDQNMIRNSPFPSHQNPFPQQEFGVQGDFHIQSAIGTAQRERKKGRIQRRKNRIQKDGRPKFQDDEPRW